MKKLLLIFLMAFAVQSVCRSQASITSDPRVLKHYTPEQIKQMESSPVKLKQVEFYYKFSYVIYNATKTPVDPLTVDITEYEHLRQEDKRIITGLNRNGSKIELISRKELLQKYQEIAVSKN